MKTIQSKLKLFLISLSVIGLTTIFLASTGYAAGTVASWESDYYDGYNHRSYGTNYNGTTAQNDTVYWQALGTSAYKNNCGVSWSTDGGTTFGHEDLYVGDTVQFKFDMYSYDNGTHLANILKSWIDWGVEDTENPIFDTVLYSDSKLVADTVDRSTATFTSGGLLLDETYLGTAYLRARVTCTESIFKTDLNNPYWNNDSQWSYTTAQYESAFDAYSNYYQGEIEDWIINVSSREVSPTPEPATFALFGMGLIGLARLGRKKA